MKATVPNNPPAVIGVRVRHPLLCAAPLLRSSLVPLWRPGGPGGPAGLVLDRPGPKKWIQAPFCGIWDAILDQIPRTRLKKSHFHEVDSQK